MLAATAERLDLPDGSVDAVAGTLVLCSVADPGRALAEVLRVHAHAAAHPPPEGFGP